jgi:TetR/AcrR family transcriptional regulator
VTTKPTKGVRPARGRRRHDASATLPTDTKEQILKVAEELFAQKGFAGVRTQQIAERAGVNKALIYYYFESKEKLLREVLQKILFELISLSNEILARKLSAAEILEQFYRGFFHYCARHKNFSRLTTMDLGSEGGSLRSLFENFFRPLFDRGVRFIDGAVERGELKPVNARQLLVTIYGMTIAYFADANQVAYLFGVEDAVTDGLIEERLEANLDFIFAAVGAKRRPRSRG